MPGSRLHCRLAQPAAGGRNRLVLAGPGGRRVAQEAQGGARVGGELEAPAGGDDQRIARRYILRRDGCGSGVRRAAPDAAPALQDVPYLFHRAMMHWARDLAGGERYLDHAASGGPMASVGQQAYLRPVGRRRVGVDGPSRQRERRSSARRVPGISRKSAFSHAVSASARPIRMSPACGPCAPGNRRTPPRRSGLGSGPAAPRSRSRTVPPASCRYAQSGAA